MMLKCLLLSALVAISQCVALEIPLMQCLKGPGGSYSSIVCEKLPNGKMELPKMPAEYEESGLSERDFLKIYVPSFISKMRAQTGLRLEYIEKPSRFFKAEVSSLCDPAEGDVIIPLPLSNDMKAKFSAEDLAIISTLKVAPNSASPERHNAAMASSERSGPNVSDINSGFANMSMFLSGGGGGTPVNYVPCAKDSNGKVSSFLAIESADGKYQLLKYPIPLSAEKDLDQAIKLILPKISKEMGCKVEYIQSPAKTIKVVQTTPLAGVVLPPFKVVPIPVPSDIKFSAEDMAVINALSTSDSPPYLIYAGVAVGVVVVLVVVFFAIRYFRNKDKNSSAI